MKSSLLLISFIFLFHLGYSQNDTTIYYKANHKPALGKEDALAFTKIKKKSENEYKFLYFGKKGERWIKSKHTRILTIENDSTIKILNQFTRNEYFKTFKPLGDYFYIKEYHKNGNLRIEGLSKSNIYNHWEGQVKEYYESGELASVCRYINNQLRGNRNWLKSGKPFFDNIYDRVDVMPEFPGGEKILMKYLSENIKYPKAAEKKKFQGRVIVSFVVDIDGKVIGTHVINPVHPLFDSEGMRVVSEMPDWSVGLLDGKPVRVGYQVPINFRLR